MSGHLGRIPSTPDARDYKLEDYLTLTPEQIQQLLDDGVAFLKQTTVGWLVGPGQPHSTAWQNNQTTFWWKGLNRIAQARAAIGPTPPPTGDIEWVDPDAPLNQGAQGTCVGHGCAQWGNSAPVTDHFTHEDALDLYYQATIYDGSPNDPRQPGGGQQGASVRSGMKALQTKGRLSTYASAGSVDAIRTWIRTKGPVVFGTDWLSGMDNPDGSGLVHATGGVRGGHCYLCLGDLVSEGNAWFLNSWGSGWGKGGYFKMGWNDVATLMGGNGEAWVAAELA